MGRPKSDQCSNGHFWTTASTKWVRPTGGTAYRVCRHCIRARKAILRTRGTEAPRIVPEGATARVEGEPPRPEPVGVIWNGWDLHHPQCPEPEAPIPPLVLFGPWSPPALGKG